MKYHSKIYATALVDVLAGKKVDPKKITDSFLRLLEKNGDSKRARQILVLTERLMLKKTGAKKIILETARPLDVKKFITSFAKKTDLVEQKINPAIIAGIKIVVDDERQLDMSLLKKLENIF